MAVAEKISQRVQQLPEGAQAEVLGFVEYLPAKAEKEQSRPQNNRSWSQLSLSLAMRGMEDEDSPEYTTADLQERFSS